MVVTQTPSARADVRRVAVAVDDLRVRRESRLVLKGVALKVSAGRIFALLGPNGAGKSTLLRAMAGLLPYDGSVRIAGPTRVGDASSPARRGNDASYEVRDLEPRERARLVAYVPQRSHLQAPFEVRAVVAQGRYAQARPRELAFSEASSDRQAIEEAMDLTDVASLAAAGRRFTELSQGEQQRVLVARALATGSRVLLLDEPSASLDIGHALRLFRLLRTLAQRDFAIVVALHALGDALEFTDDAMLLEAGTVRGLGPTSTVVAPGVLEQVYGVLLVPRGGLGFRLADDAAAPFGPKATGP